MSIKELDKLRYKIYAILNTNVGAWRNSTEIVRMLEIEYDVRLNK